MEQNLQFPVSKPRMEWIDAMRGFTMIMVVMYHVALQSFYQNPNTSSSMTFLVLMRMPMFFFISGFLAYKSNQEWSFDNTKRLIGKKLRVQIIPTVVFFFVNILLLYPKAMSDRIIYSFHSSTKGGYWFTLVLLYMFVVYYVFEYIEHLFKRQRLWSILTLLILAIALAETCFLPRYFPWAQGHRPAYKGWLHDTSIIEFMRYFQFFVFGNIVHRYWQKFEKLYDKPGFYLAIVGIAFLGCGDYLKWHVLRMAWANIPRTLAQYSMLTLVFLCFRYYQNAFSRQTRIGRGLQYIGTRTLDVYLIHYLFLPYLPEVGKYFNTHTGNFAIDVVASLVVALIVVGFCLITSNILRVSPFLKKYLFGR